MLKIKKILVKTILFKINFINLTNFQKIVEGINFNINHGSSFMLVNSVVNPDPGVAKERVYQDYIQKCQILLVERLELAKKLVINLILREQAWSHIVFRKIFWKQKNICLDLI
jgi:allantoicase